MIQARGYHQVQASPLFTLLREKPTPNQHDLEPVSGNCGALGGKALRAGVGETQRIPEPAGGPSGRP